jgi:sugar transferase (PEP-CTERM system associated)
LRESRLRGARVFNEIGFWEQCLSRVNIDRIDRNWFLGGEGFSDGRLGAAMKRGIDILASLLLLALTLPLMLVVALAVTLDSPGPLLYRQRRVGLHGKPFTLLKFRSMRADAEAGGTPRWAARRDDRVTRVGRFIRSTRIDELPQLFNVLSGEMSLVGPRPERPHFVEQLAEVIPFYPERVHVKPGITGWAQVNYPYGASVEDAREKLSYDLYYLKNRSLLLDLLILVSTVRVVLFREGAR